MKKALFPVSLFLLLLAVAILAGCSKDSTSTNNNNPPTSPTNFTASQASRRAVNLTWGAAGADSFQIQRSPDSTSWAALASTSTTSYNDSTNAANRRLYYRVKGSNANGTSDYSYTSLWTLPGVWDFSSSSQLSNFNLEELNGGSTYSTWTWDQNEGTNGAGLFTFTSPQDTQRLARIVTTSSNLMPHDGWLESKIKVEQWHGTGADASYASFFIERNPNDPTQGVVGVFFSADSTVLAYTVTSDTLRRLATNPTLPLLSDNAWHTVRFFHSAGHWDFYIDGTRVWNGDIPNVLDGNYQVYQEWQFDKGTATGNQRFWIDDFANNHALPAAVTMAEEGGRNLDGQVIATKSTGAHIK
ncbi:MAG TPA: hypothetical protein VGL38_13810 [bacterium]|jgi:hypothetical protein